MKIVNVVFGDWKLSDVKYLAANGIAVDEGADSFEIEKGDRFDELIKKLDKSISHVSTGTYYDKNDLDSSGLLMYNGWWENGYPQPEENFDYLNVSYDLTKYCDKCRIGAVQKAPFRLKREPQWSKNIMFELNWVFDEIFVKKDVYESLFATLGIQSLPVLLHKKETVIENTVQLKIPFTSAKLDLSKQPFEECAKCRRKKYSPQIAGLFPPFVGNVEKVPIFKCNEYFGSGGQADHRIFVTQMMRQLFIENKIKVNLVPVSLDRQ